MTKILKCTCKHQQQDRLHGTGKRVFNLTLIKSSPPTYRCTVCDTQKTAAASST